MNFEVSWNFTANLTLILYSKRFIIFGCQVSNRNFDVSCTQCYVTLTEPYPRKPFIKFGVKSVESYGNSKFHENLCKFNKQYSGESSSKSRCRVTKSRNMSRGGGHFMAPPPPPDYVCNLIFSGNLIGLADCTVRNCHNMSSNMQDFACISGAIELELLTVSDLTEEEEQQMKRILCMYELNVHSLRWGHGSNR